MVGAVFESPPKRSLNTTRFLQNGKVVASVLSIEPSKTYSLLLHVGAREVNKKVETAVKLFPARTYLDTVGGT
jgi:hypothetical protein